MKIFFIGRYNDSKVLSGPEKFANRIYNELQDSTQELSFFTYFFGKNNLYKKLFGLEVVDQQKNIYRTGIILLVYILIKSQPDIIHIVTEERFVIPIFIFKKFIKAKIISSVHGILRIEIKKTKSIGYLKDIFLEYLITKFSDKLILFSVKQLELLKKYYKFNDKNVEFIFNGADISFHRIRKNFDYSKGLKVVFYEGNPSVYRGTDIIIELIKKINNFKVKLFILSNRDFVSGKKEKNLNSQITDSIQIYYIKLMEQERLVRFLSSTHVFLKGPVFDSFPIMVIECMSNGMIVIVPKDIGCARYIEHGINGFIYDDTKLEEVNELLNQIYYKKYNVLKISQNASMIIYQLNWKNVAVELKKIYQNTN